jgi:ferredoxin
MGMTVRFIDSAGNERDSGLCERNLNLLAHSQAIELEVGSRCGGHGVCGGDRVLPIDEPSGAQSGRLSPLTDAERRHLSADEIAAGWRLACQCFPENSDKQILVKLPSQI